jgi:hypothetical protein
MLKAGTAARRRSLRWNTAQSPDALQGQVAALLTAIDERLRARNDAWIGHVKILISGEQSMYGSITAAGDPPHWAGKLTAPLDRAEITVYAAIYDLTNDHVADAVDTSLRYWVTGMGKPD